MIDRYTGSITAILTIFVTTLLGVHLLNTSNPVVAHPGDVPSSAGFKGTLTSDPSDVAAGEPFDLTVTLFEPDGTTPIPAFEEVHTKLLHLILVSQDLQQFLHVHPDYEGSGTFILKDLTLPASGNYAVFADFTPPGFAQQVVRLGLSTTDAETGVPQLSASSQEAVVGPLKIVLELPNTLLAEAENVLRFDIMDAETGEPISTLDSYLGAAGHLVIIDQSSQVYIHTHPAGHDMEGMSESSEMAMDMPAATGYGPQIEFEARFPMIGWYPLWLQVQYQGEVFTAPFVVSVNDLAAAPAESTPAAHSGHG